MTQRPDEKRDSNSPGTPDLADMSRVAEGEFHARVAATGGVAVVLFSTSHCGACRAWKRLLPDALSSLVDVFFEVDVGEATGVARYFDIFHLPTVYLYRGGRFHAELQCEAQRETIRETVRSLLAAQAQDEP